MFGTGEEILWEASHYGRFLDLLDMSAQAGSRLRKRIKEGLSDEELDSYLTRIGAAKIRDSVIVPAAIKDKKGRVYTETTFLFFNERLSCYEDLNLRAVCARLREGIYPDETLVREVMRRQKAYYYAKRVVLPSLWELTVDWSRSHRHREIPNLSGLL